MQTDEIPAGCGEIARRRHTPECARNARESPPISQNPASPAAAQRGISAEEGRARVRSGATGGAGEGSAPVPRPAVSQPPHPLQVLPASKGGRPRRSPDSAGRRTAPRFFSGRLGVPHAKITLHFAKSWIFPLATRWPAFSGEAKYEHSLSAREQSGRPRLERQPRRCARDDTIFTDRGNAIWLNLPEEQADLKD